MTTTWVLLIFLKMAYAGGVTTITFPTFDGCSRALHEARQMETFEDGKCIEVWTGGTP